MIYLRRRISQRRLRLHPPGLIHSQTEILAHQLDAEPAIIVMFRGSALTYAGNRIVGLAAPAGAAAPIDQLGQDFWVQPPRLAEVHGFGGGDVADGQEVVVGQLAAQARPLAAQVQDFGAHCFQQGADPPFDQAAVLAVGADHEGQGGGLGADDAAGHGRVDEAALGSAVDGVGDFAGGGGVDGGAVDEEPFGRVGVGEGDLGEGRVEDGVEDVLDVGGLGEGGDDDFLHALLVRKVCILAPPQFWGGKDGFHEFGRR